MKIEILRWILGVSDEYQASPMNIRSLRWILGFSDERWDSLINIRNHRWILGITDEYWDSPMNIGILRRILGFSDEHWRSLMNIGGLWWTLGVSDEYLGLQWQYQSRYSCGFVIIIFYSPPFPLPPPPRVISLQAWGFFYAFIYRPVIINIIPLF